MNPNNNEKRILNENEQQENQLISRRMSKAANIKKSLKL